MGAHRLGSNKIFSLNINGSNSQVILKTKKLDVTLQKSLFSLSNSIKTSSPSSLGLVKQAMILKKLKKKASTVNSHSLVASFLGVETEVRPVEVSPFKKTTFLGDLRFFVASKIHQNLFYTPFLLKNKSNKVMSKDFTMLEKKVKQSEQNKKKSSATVFYVCKEKKENKLVSSFFQLVFSKPKKELAHLKSYSTIQRNFKLKEFWDNKIPKQVQDKDNIEHFKNIKVLKPLLHSSPSSLALRSRLLAMALARWPIGPRATGKGPVNGSTPKKPPFATQNTLSLPIVGEPISKKREAKGKETRPNDRSINSSLAQKFVTNYSKLIKENGKSGPLYKIMTLKAWPENVTSNRLSCAYLFWKLKDLVFFRGNFTRKTKIYFQLRISINHHWWGLQNSPYLLPKNNSIKKNKALNLIKESILKENTKEIFIKNFPNLILNLFARFKIEKSLNNLSESYVLKPFIKQTQSRSTLFDNTLSSFKGLNITRPRIKFQNSGEIFPLQGNTNFNEFINKFRFQKRKLNSGLLMHYNRVSYKIPLCHAYSKDPLIAQRYNPILNRERLAVLRQELAMLAVHSLQSTVFVKPSVKSKQHSLNSTFSSLFGVPGVPSTQSNAITKSPLAPQIGDFINIGDEIIKECASAYCGQIIEKSPVGLTLRLTQNILYSNFRNRPAKINQNFSKKGNWIEKGASLVTVPYISNVTGDIVAGIPKIEQLFEARGEALEEAVEKIWTSYKISIVPRAKAVRECFKEIGLFVVAAIQKVYSSQGVHIADKHLEVIIRQMTRRALVVDPGDTEFLPEEFVDLNTIECVNWATYGDTAIYRPRLIGITKASLTSNSFLSSASFQQTARVLERETILEKTDRLLGLKERVMMGALINAGTGELKTTVRLSDRSLAKSLSTKLVQRLSFFSRRKITGILRKKTSA